MDDIVVMVEKIEAWFVKADYEKAYEEFFKMCMPYPDFQDSATSFYARFNDLNNQIMQGIIRNEDQAFEKRQIGNAFLMCLKSFKEEQL